MAVAKALFGALSNLIPTSAYRSRLEPAIEALPQEKMTPEQALGSFKKFPGGVGEDELQYTGIKGILEQGQPVTKTSLLEQVRSNPLEITDVYKGDSPLNPDSINFDQAAHDLAWKKIDEAEAAGDWITVEKLENQIEMLPKFSQYTLPGGSNYQELLMTLPEEKAKFSVFSGDTRIMDETFSSGSEARTAALEEGLGEIGYTVRQTNSPQNFKSSHYDESNILAHGRYNTRTIDGDKTLFIEEIQSDLHQAGRDKGYIDTKKRQAADDAITAKRAEIEQIEIEYEAAKQPIDLTSVNSIDDLPMMTADESKIWDRRDKAINELAEIVNQRPKTSDGVPDAPYKSTDKWAGLTFNRMLKQAVDSGHDRIAWTSGQIQADRYDLSDKIDKIEVTDAIDLSKSGKGSGLIYNDNVRITKMRDPDGSTVMDLAFNKEGKILQGDGKGKNLSEVVGKELAEKLIKSKGSVNFSGDDLSIGGEGMKEFYDKILPKISGKIAKKYNSKVEVSADSLYDANPDLIQGTGRNRIDAIEDARDEVRYDGSGRLVPDADEYKAIQNGDVWEAYFDYDVGKGQQVWSMKITPEMKKAVAGGVALSGAGVAVLPEGSE